MKPDWNHHYASVNGIRVHFVRHGRGFPLLLLHGWPEFWRIWCKNIPVLAEGFDVVVPDLRGFGDTDKPPGSALTAYTPAHCQRSWYMSPERSSSLSPNLSHRLSSRSEQATGRTDAQEGGLPHGTGDDREGDVSEGHRL